MVADLRFRHTFTNDSSPSRRGIDITYTSSEATAAKWIIQNGIDSLDVLGVDAEWKPVFRSGAVPKLALLQIATSSSVLIVQINAFAPCREGSSSGALLRLLNSGTKLFAGMGIDGDLDKVGAALARFQRAGAPIALNVKRQTVDLKRFGQSVGVNVGGGLQGLTLHLLPEVAPWKTKRLQMSDWSRFPLNDRQICYAAMDAWASLACYTALLERQKAARPVVHAAPALQPPALGGAAVAAAAEPARSPSSRGEGGGAAAMPAAPAAASSTSSVAKKDAQLAERLSTEQCKRQLEGALRDVGGWLADKTVQLLFPKQKRPLGCKTVAAFGEKCGVGVDSRGGGGLFTSRLEGDCYSWDQLKALGALLRRRCEQRSFNSVEWGTIVPHCVRPIGSRHDAKGVAVGCGLTVQETSGGFTVKL